MTKQRANWFPDGFPEKYKDSKGTWICVDFAHTEMLNWLENNLTAHASYAITPRLSGYRTLHEIYFRYNEDVMYFKLRWGEEII